MSAFLHQFPARRFWLLSTLFLALSGCSEARDVDATDTKTNWLSRCEQDSDCVDGLDCLCGICTLSCERAADCSELPAAACATASECSNAGPICIAEPSRDAATPTDDGSETEGAPDAGGTATGTSPDAGPVQTGTATSDAAPPAPSDAGALPDAASPGPDAASPSDGGSCADPSRDYKSRDPETCTLIDFVCEEGTQHFFDDCGCGCEPANDAGTCDEEGKDYVSRDPEECTRIDFQCDESAEPFFDDCGCGCQGETLPEQCQIDGRTYVSTDPEQCALIDYDCASGTVHFTDDCGCGCEPDPAAEPQCSHPEGSEVFAEVLPVSTGECFDVTPGGQLLESAEQFEQFLAVCGAAPQTPEVDFETQRVFAATVADRPSVSFLYAVEVDGAVRIGVEAQAYCGGARPPAGIVLLVLEASSTDVVQETCFTGECMGPPPP